jgi:hypothetical protein
MVGVSHPIDFAFSDIDVDGNSLAEPWQICLRIVGSFAIKVGENILYSEQGFCLVEFGIESQLWLKRVKKTQEDFVYTSQESEELGLVWIKREGSVLACGLGSPDIRRASRISTPRDAASVEPLFHGAPQLRLKKLWRGHREPVFMGSTRASHR